MRIPAMRVNCSIWRARTPMKPCWHPAPQKRGRWICASQKSNSAVCSINPPIPIIVLSIFRRVRAAPKRATGRQCCLDCIYAIVSAKGFRRLCLRKRQARWRVSSAPRSRWKANMHTSFASVFVYPEVDDAISIEINPADLRIDTFRASGAGGQHVNKTDSAIRMTHLPSGIVVQCQNDRSQHRNRAEAMAMLRARLYEAELRKRQSEQATLEASKTDVGWGRQIRSYVLDQSRVKDLRTGVETSNTRAVLDGDIDLFIVESLKQRV